MCGDYLERMKEIPDGSIDCIITDPPYATSRKTGFSSGGDTKKFSRVKMSRDWDNIVVVNSEFMEECYRVLKKHGTLFMFYDVWKLQEVLRYSQQAKFSQPRVGQWIKTNPVPINQKVNYLCNAGEFFVTFSKCGKPTFNSTYDNGLYFYPICHGKERTPHLTQKPLALMTEIINKHTTEDDIVLDCFMGSGTTGVAAVELGRSFIGIEIDKEYCVIAKKRIKEVSLCHMKCGNP